jgi:lambda repressor-like predicted transcriptional regulator
MATRRPNGAWIVSRLPNGDWHPEEIKAAVRMTVDADGVPWTLGQLALSCNLPSGSCRYAIRKPHHGGEIAIASLLRLAPQAIWPSRFRGDGTRIPEVRAASKSRAPSSPRHGEKRSAA